MVKILYVLKFGGEKEVNEMEALELKDLDDCYKWIRDSLECDSEYHNFKVDILDFECFDYDNEGNDICKLLINIGKDDLNNRNLDVFEIVRSSLDVVSEIKGEIELD